MADFKPRYRRGSWAERVTFCRDRPVLLAPATYLGGYAAPPTWRRGSRWRSRHRSWPVRAATSRCHTKRSYDTYRW